MVALLRLSALALASAHALNVRQASLRQSSPRMAAGTQDELLTAPPVAPAKVTSWYDAGIRLSAEVADEPAPVVAEAPAPAKMTASAEASAAAALVSGLAVLGLDIASFGVVENLDAVLLVGGLALSQVDSAGPVGATLRTVGNVTSFATREVVLPVTKGVAGFYSDNEIGYKSRALLEMGIESALFAFDPGRREREAEEAEADRAAAQAAAEAAAEQARRDALPWWDPQKYA